MIRLRMIGIIGFITVAVLVTWVRGRVYENEFTVWSDVVNKSPQKARAHNNLGHALKEIKLIEEAMKHFERAIELNPEYVDALNNLATIYSAIGRRSEALSLLDNALSINPDYLPARHNLALRYYEMGYLDEAMREYSLIIRLDPYSKEATFARRMLMLIQRQKSKE